MLVATVVTIFGAALLAFLIEYPQIARHTDEDFTRYEAFITSLLVVPYRFMPFMPLLLTLIIFFMMVRDSGHGEFVVYGTMGLSPYRAVLPNLFFVAVAGILWVLANNYIAKPSYQLSAIYRNYAEHGEKEGGNITIYDALQDYRKSNLSVVKSNMLVMNNEGIFMIQGLHENGRANRLYRLANVNLLPKQTASRLDIFNGARFKDKKWYPTGETHSFLYNKDRVVMTLDSTPLSAHVRSSFVEGNNWDLMQLGSFLVYMRLTPSNGIGRIRNPYLSAFLNQIFTPVFMVIGLLVISGLCYGSSRSLGGSARNIAGVAIMVFLYALYEILGRMSVIWSWMSGAAELIFLLFALVIMLVVWRSRFLIHVPLLKFIS